MSEIFSNGTKKKTKLELINQCDLFIFILKVTVVIIMLHAHMK